MSFSFTSFSTNSHHPTTHIELVWRNARRPFMLLITVLLLPVFASAQVTWTGNTSTNWATPTNWDGGKVPTATDDVVIPSTTIKPTIEAGTVASAKTVEVKSGGALTLASSSTLAVNGSKTLLNTTICFFSQGTINNNGLLILGNTASLGKYGVYNRGTFNNNSGGEIQIDNATFAGLYVDLGTFTNAAKIVIGATVSVGEYGLWNNDTFNNNTGGEIQIDKVTNTGLFNQRGDNLSGSFTNAAKLVIGAKSSVGFYGLYNNGTFLNNSGGDIQIDNATNSGLYNLDTFTNAAKLVVGSKASVGLYGLYNIKIFNNNSGGEIRIDNSTSYGVLSAGGTFTNAAKLIVGANASVGDYGLYNGSIFNNTTGGEIQLDNAVINGLYNKFGTFTNAAKLIIGARASDKSNVFANEATFINSSCATVSLFGVLSNSSSLSNQGLMTVNTTKAHSNTALTNNGVIVYPQGNPIPNVTNNKLIASPLSTTCGPTASPALEIGGSNDLVVGTTWYQNEALTTEAGTYSPNTFTATNLSAGTAPVYFTVTNPGTCSFTVSIPLTVTLPPVVNISASATAVNSGQSVTLTASGGTTYRWSTSDTNPIITVTPPTGSTPYSVTVTNAGGCSATATITITATATSGNLVTAPATLCVKSNASSKTEVILPVSMTLTAAPAPYTYSWSYKAPNSTNYKAIPAKGSTIGKVSFLPVAGQSRLNLVGTNGNLNGLQGYLIRLVVTLGDQPIGSAETLLDGSCPLSIPRAREGVVASEISLEVGVYPNPVTDVLQVEVRGMTQPARLGLYDLQGRLRGQWSLTPVEGVGQLRAPVSELVEGIYLLQVADKDGIRHQQRVIKQR